MGEHAFLEEGTRPAGLRYRRTCNSGQRDSDHTDHHRRRQTYHGLLARTVLGRRARHGIAFPTVPEGKARIRTIMTATHTKEELEQALAVLKNVGKRMGILGN